MFNFEKIIEKAIARIDSISLKHERCSKIRSPLSKCRKCIEICPVEGIDIKGQQIEFNQNCIQCGLCAGICSTGAITIQEPTELSLYKYIEDARKSKTTAVITCKYNEEDSNHIFKVPCLGSLTLEFLWGIDVLDEVYVVFSEQKCGKCSVKKGLQIYLEKISAIKKLELEFKLKGDGIKHIKQSPKIKYKKLPSEEFNEERREFLSAIFKFAKNIPDMAINHALGKQTENKPLELNHTVRRYLIMKKVLDGVGDTKLEEKEVGGFLKPHRIGTCKFCRACSILCPTGALKHEEIDDNLNITLTLNSCTGCGLCVNVCYYKALDLKNKKMKEFYPDEKYLLVGGRVQQCRRCKKVIKSSSVEEICPSCLKQSKK